MCCHPSKPGKKWKHFQSWCEKRIQFGALHFNKFGPWYFESALVEFCLNVLECNEPVIVDVYYLNIMRDNVIKHSKSSFIHLGKYNVHPCTQ